MVYKKRNASDTMPPDGKPVEASSVPQRKNGQKTKKRRKKSSADESNEQTQQERRDFSADLLSYLQLWEAHSQGDTSSGWKFNKVLQNWALENFSDKKKVSASLFDSLLPYLDSIVGGARDRVIEVITCILSLAHHFVLCTCLSYHQPSLICFFYIGLR
jgi:hypothetical protein